MESPAFGQATLSNCERELIHLAGSVQPHGVLLLLQATAGLPVLQASQNTAALLGLEAEALLGQPLSALGGDVAEAVSSRLPQLAGLGEEPLPLRCHSGQGRERRYFEGTLHQPPGGGLVLELEPTDRGVGLAGSSGAPIGLTDLHSAHGARSIAAAVQRFSAAGTLNGLCEAVVQVLRELTGYDRVMVYRFDPDGHGEIFAEAKAPALEPLLGHHYPATDIPQRARELYLRMRLRVLADVHYEPAPLVPPLRPDSGEPLDMSMCHLRSMSPLHLQYLKNMGVTGTLVAALVREGRLWGLIAAHHYQPRHLRLALRQVVELLAEVASTRIAAIENYAHVQVALMVQRLEQRLIEATSTEGDWRQALLRSPQTLLQALEATGAALFHGDEVLTTGEVPSTRELRALCEWVHAQPVGADEGAPFSCTSVGRLHPPLAGLAATACGVMAVRLSLQRPEYLMWFRPEQLQTVKWAGNPDKAALLAGEAAEGADGPPQDPLQLSPRRSFATWSEIVRGSARPWTLAERSMARAIGTALVDIIVQVNAVRLLIAEHQLAQIRATVHATREPVLMTDAAGRLIFANQAFGALRGSAGLPAVGSALTGLFEDPARVQAVLAELVHQAWRGDWVVAGPGTPVAVRAEAVPARDNSLLGCIFVFDDLRARRQTARARQRLEASLMQASSAGRPHDEVLGAILGNASLAAMDIADAVGAPSVAPLLQEVEASAQRATQLYDRLRSFTAGG
ncbi:hypothetical protein IP87_15440 [beta proteobacterium AAP121]|nr:hypothetical protein IP80_05700 [beta proteobacterium AAP65]KPF95926.1 hypothetical protein IP87_15440 [beta proteobacterium AAP121]